MACHAKRKETLYRFITVFAIREGPVRYKLRLMILAVATPALLEGGELRAQGVPGVSSKEIVIGSCSAQGAQAYFNPPGICRGDSYGNTQRSGSAVRGL